MSLKPLGCYSIYEHLNLLALFYLCPLPMKTIGMPAAICDRVMLVHQGLIFIQYFTKAAKNIIVIVKSLKKNVELLKTYLE